MTPDDTPWDEAPAAGTVQAIAPGIEWLRLPLPMALDHVNAYILEERGGVTIVDTGIASRRGREIWRAALRGRPVRRVIATHHHPDHFGLAGWFAAEDGARILMTRTAYLTGRMLQLDEQARPLPEAVAFWRAAGMDPDILAQRTDARPVNFADSTHPLPLGYTRLAEGDMLDLADARWRVRLGDGHAPEHATFWSEDGAFVLAGDQILASITPNVSLYATEPEADPLGDWLRSCARMQTALGDGDPLILPGHKHPFRGAARRLDRMIESHHAALDRLRVHLQEPKSAGACFAPLFRRHLSGGEYGLALGEAMAHCVHLWHRGEAVRQIGDDGAWLFQMRR